MANAYQTMDTDLTLLQNDAGGELSWHRAYGGARVSCALADVLAVNAQGSALYVHHYPLVQDYGCCSRGDATRRPKRYCVQCSSSAEAQAWASRISAACGPRPRRFAVFVNPVGGTGRALFVYRTQVLPLLQTAGVDITLTLTERRGHATEVASRLDLSSVDAVLVVSGDGLLCEVYNGLQAHAQHELAAAMPLGIVPAGSGNAVAKSLAARAGEACTPVNATLAALCCTAPMPLDAALVRQRGAPPIHALLSLSWALVADVDIESEALRALGPARFTVQALLRCALLRRYAGRLLFLPSTSGAAAAAGRPATADEAARAQSLDDGVPEPGGDEPSGWRVIDGPLENVWALNLPWGGEDALAAPGAVADDGCFDVVVFRGGSPMAVAAALMAFEKGEHVDHACVTVVKATAFVLEPGEPDSGGSGGGNIVLDGELVARRGGKAAPALPLSYAPIHVRVRRGAARMLARRETATTLH